MNLKSTYTILCLTVACIFTACTSNKQKEAAQNIMVSILPQKYIVEQILDHKINVDVMVTSGASPATYSPVPSQMKALQNTKVYIKIGHIGFEQSWMPKLSEIQPNMIIADSSEGIEVLHSEEEVHGDHVHYGGVDPHTWTSPKTFIQIIKNTQSILLKYYPELNETIRKNTEILLNKVKAIDEQYNSRLTTFGGKKFLIFHPAYTYLAHDYSLHQITIETDGKEPSVKWLKDVISDAKKHHINTIFIQKEFDSKNAILVADELGIKIVEVSPLEEDWISNSETFLEELIKALE